MEKVKVFYDRDGNTLTVWFGNPADEYICEETVHNAFFGRNFKEA